MAYATTTDLAKRWRDLSPKEQTIAAQLLDDAAVIIDSVADASQVEAAVLSIVSCNMVRRAMSANGDSFALGSTHSDIDSSTGIAWTPYEATGSITDALWLSYSDRKMLKVYAGRYYTVPPLCGYKD